VNDQTIHIQHSSHRGYSVTLSVHVSRVGAFLRSSIRPLLLVHKETSNILLELNRGECHL